MSSHAPEVPRSSICLNMIVKNEAHVIARCIKSVKPHITSWVIVDTGSTDGTQELIKELLKDIPGELHERPWKDFSANRNEAIELARGKADYLMVVDADDVIVGACPHRLIHSHYMLTVEDGGIVYDRCHIFKSTLPFHYVGVLHEYLECKTPGLNPVKLPSLKYRRYHEGARSKDKKDTYLRDAAILTAALETEKDEYLQRRYAFYLANSYKDAGEPEKAIDAYEKRAVMGGGFIEEIFISLLYVAELKASLDRPEDEVEKAYLRAYESRPGRIEAIHDLCVYLRLKEKYQKAYLYAKGVMDKKHTTDTLFVNEQVYRWKMLDETAVAAFYCGEKDVSRTICEELLQNQLISRRWCASGGSFHPMRRNFRALARANVPAPRKRPISTRVSARIDTAKLNNVSMAPNSVPPAPTFSRMRSSTSPIPDGSLFSGMFVSGKVSSPIADASRRLFSMRGTSCRGRN